MMRVGHGFDVHAFGEPAADATLTLGGVSIAYERPLLAHSDGDVLLHALCDALLGAMDRATNRDNNTCAITKNGSGSFCIKRPTMAI